MRTPAMLASILLMLVVLSGCRESAQTATVLPEDTRSLLTEDTPAPTSVQSATIQVDLSTEPNPPAAGEGYVIVTVTDAAGQPVDVLSLRVRGDMTHAGMIPEFGVAEESANGVNRVPFNFSMGGDWILSVEITMPDESAIEREFNVTVGS